MEKFHFPLEAKIWLKHQKLCPEWKTKWRNSFEKDRPYYKYTMEHLKKEIGAYSKGFLRVVLDMELKKRNKMEKRRAKMKPKQYKEYESKKNRVDVITIFNIVTNIAENIFGGYGFDSWLKILGEALEKYLILNVGENAPNSKQALLLLDSRLSHYNPATWSLARVQIDGIPYMARKAVKGVHIPSFVSPKDIIRDYISKHPEEIAETYDDIKLPAWTTRVAGLGEKNESEVVEIPKGQPTPCLPLPKDLKHVSAATASTLLDMISGLNTLLLHKSMEAKDEIERLSGRRM
ncbi:hypothetical protein ACLB2K_075727 [Fragaria x ananassa]